MEFNYRPARIFIFREFPVTTGEITVLLNNTSDKTWYLHPKGIIRNNRFLPIGQITLDTTDATRHDSGHFILAPGQKTELAITIERRDLELTEHGQDYTICLQAETRFDRFAWMDGLTEKLEAFQTFSQAPDPKPATLNRLYETLLRSLPEKMIEVPFTARALVQSKEALCLDFGTSYSVCAAYVPGNLSKDLLLSNKLEVNKINFNLFRDHQGHESKIEPTKLLLKSYNPETGKKKWAYGYEAEQIADQNLGKATYILGIKIMLGDLEKEITCYDIEGNAVNLNYEEILTEYLNYLVRSSKKFFGIDFKTVHVSTPVLYTTRQREAYEKILTQIGIEHIEAKLDEAKSPLYFFLSDRINQHLLQPDVEPLGTRQFKYFVIDCGGGSTDATLINNIEIRSTDDGTDAVELDFKEVLIVGNPFFGGQVLTLYLFKYLKYLMALRIGADGGPQKPQTRYPVDHLLNYSDSDIYWNLYKMEQDLHEDTAMIAKKQKDDVYKLFNATYQELETQLPTRFRDYQNREKSFYFSVCDNFNLLWQLAESIKVRIYATDAPARIRLGELKKWRNARGVWCQATNSADFAYIKDIFNDIQVNTYELNKIFRPIIFIEISRLFRNLGISDRELLDKALSVRFVGQTTKIPLFDESLAYHIPRKVIETDRNEGNGIRFQATKPEDKKLCTASGAAQYLRHVLSGKVVDRNFTENEYLMFDIYRFDDDAATLKRRLIARGQRVSEAETCYMRPQASQNEDFIGYRFEEYNIFLGTVTFELNQITRALNEEETEHLSERHPDSRKLKQKSNILVVVKVVNVNYAQKIIFYPHIIEDGIYKTTEQPVELKFQSDSMFSRNFMLNGEI